MRRPAPDAPPSKRLRTGREGPEARSFAELGRFDYRAAEQLTRGAQGFIVTCGFQRYAACSFDSMRDIADHMLRCNVHPRSCNDTLPFECSLIAT